MDLEKSALNIGKLRPPQQNVDCMVFSPSPFSIETSCGILQTRPDLFYRDVAAVLALFVRSNVDVSIYSGNVYRKTRVRGI